MKSSFRSVLCQSAFLFLSAVCILIAGSAPLSAETLTWDAKPLQGGLQNGSGAWDTTSNLWMNAENQNVLWSNSPLVTAQFGTTPAVNPSVVTLAQNVQLKGINFLTLGTAAPAAGSQYVLEGASAGTVLDFGESGLIQVENFASGGSSNFIEFRNTLTFKGNNLTIQKSSGTETQFMNIRMVSNPDLTGNLTIGSYIYAAFYSADAFSGLDRLTVLNNGNLVLSAAGDYSVPMTVTGYTSAYSAIRVTASDVILSGGLTLAGDAGIYMHSSNTGMIINAPITESIPGSGLHRFSLTKNNGTLSLTAANTYTGKTTLGRTLSTNAGGITILDFADAGAPQDNILYNGVTTPGGLELLGSTIGSTSLVLNGKSGVINSQAFGDVTARQTRSVVTLLSGVGGAMNLSVGTISRVTTGMVAFNAPAQGQISTSMADSILGPWATFKSADGVQSWAQVTGGVLTGFNGSTPHATGVSPASDATSHLAIDGTSTGDVMQTIPLAYLATVSMNDTNLDRTFNVGSGNTLRLGANGGVQITSTGKSLTIGESGVISYLSAGGEVAGASQIILTNNSATSLLTIHSGITNNAGGGAVNVLVNGAADSTTVLTAPGTQTGGAIIASGAVELRDGTALGTAGTVNILEDGALRFSGGITFSRPVTLSGLGTAGALSEGRLRNISGDNTTTGLVTLLTPTNIFSETGTLTIKSASATANAITGTFALGFAGPGNVTVDGRIAISTAVMTKTGSGTLTLAGDNTFTSAFTISGGAVRVTHANGLGTTAGGTTINANSALELSGGISVAEPITLASAGVANGGGIRNFSGTNTLTGQVLLNATTNRINSDSGLLILNASSGNSILHSSSSSRTLILGGEGDIAIRGPVTRTGAGAFTFQKEGNGILTLAAPVANTITTVSGGNVHLDFSAPLSPAENILHNGVTAPGTFTLNGARMLITGKSGATNHQTFGATTFTGTGYMTVAQNGATGVNVAFGALTRSTGGVLGITLPAAGNVTTTGGADNALITNTVGTPFMWSLNPVSGDEWLGTKALAGGVRQIVPLSALTSGGYTPSGEGSLSGNADITLGETTTTLSGNTSITTLRFAQPQATLITQSANTLLNLAGILVSSTAGPHTQTISVRQLQAHPAAAGNELPIIQNNTAAPLIISSSIINQATSGQATALTKSGPGTLVLTGANAYSGSTRVQEGILHLRAGSISGSTEFILGSGSHSGKIILGYESTAFNATMDWLQVLGTGTDNRIVGGASVISLLTVDNPTTNNNYRTGFLGGPGVNENNLALSVYDVSTNTTSGVPTVMFLPLGPANTYDGRTQIRNAIVEVSVLADQGLTSSFGTGNADGVIEMGSGGSSTIPHILAALRYVGSADSTTDRPLNIANTTAAVLSITTVLENNGTGSLKFTSPFTSAGTNVTASRLFRLSGTHAGDSQIVGIGDNGTAPTVFEKTGPGAWTLTGASTYSGGTTVSEGTLLVANVTGSATGSGAVTLLPGTTFGGSGRIELAADRSITVGGGRLQIGLDYPGVTPLAGNLTIITSGDGMLSFESGSVLLFDLISGAGAGDNTAALAAADRATFQGAVEFGSNVTLKVSNPTGMTTWAANDQWRLFDWAGLSGPVSGTVSSYDLPSLPSGMMWDTSSLFTSGVLSISLVPEPSRCVLGFLGTLVILGMRRRQSGKIA